MERTKLNLNSTKYLFLLEKKYVVTAKYLATIAQGKKNIIQITHNLTIIILLVEIFLALLVNTIYSLSAIIPGS